MDIQKHKSYQHLIELLLSWVKSGLFVILNLQIQFDGRVQAKEAQKVLSLQELDNVDDLFNSL